MKRIAVIGGNAAGPSAAAKAKRVNPDAEVVLFEGSNFISTGTCELPYLISGEIKDYSDILFYNAESFYEEKKVKVYTGHFAEQIDRREKRIIVRNNSGASLFDYNYDKLVIATGSTAVTHPAFVKKYSNVFYLKNVSDYLRIKDYTQTNNVKKVLVIGAGYLGLEAAEAFKITGCEVDLIEKDNLPGPAMDEEVRILIKEIISANGIEFKGGVRDLSVFDNGERVTKVKYNSIPYEYDLILISAGFEPNTQLAFGARLNIGRAGGIQVDNRLRTSDQHIYSAGDCIEVINRITGRPELMPLATLAHLHGHIAGANAAGENIIAEPVIRNSAVKVFDRVVVSVGLNSAQASENGFRWASVSAVLPNLVRVMPASRKVYGKIIFEKGNRRILGAQFIGEKEAVSYGDLVSSLIYQKSDGALLGKFNFNYTPPCSPFINLLSVLGRKIEGER